MQCKNFVFFVVLTAILMLTACGSRDFHFQCGISDVSKLGINHLQPFVEAMEKYKTDKGHYPKYGTDLVPGYIDKVPTLASENETFDETKINVLRNDKLGSDKSRFADDGSYFSIEFLPKDDRFCLMGKNNICEYTSDTKKWGCYQH
jgi:hypothetical protein